MSQISPVFPRQGAPRLRSRRPMAQPGAWPMQRLKTSPWWSCIAACIARSVHATSRTSTTSLAILPKLGVNVIALSSDHGRPRPHRQGRLEARQSDGRLRSRALKRPRMGPLHFRRHRQDLDRASKSRHCFPNPACSWSGPTARSISARSRPCPLPGRPSPKSSAPPNSCSNAATRPAAKWSTMQAPKPPSNPLYDPAISRATGCGPWSYSADSRLYASQNITTKYQ